MTYFRNLFVAVLLAGALAGCLDSSQEFSVRYETLGDLKPKAAVYLDNRQVGKVVDISSTERGDYLVEVTIDSDYKDTVMQSAKFFIEADPLDSKRRALLIEQDAAGGTPLQDGAVVKGEARRGVLGGFMSSLKKKATQASGQFDSAIQGLKKSLSEGSSNLNRQLEGALDDLDSYFQEFDRSLKAPLKDDELEKLQGALDEFIDEFNSANEDVQNKMREEILPHIRKNLEELQERLRRDGQEQDAEELDTQLHQIMRV